VDDHCKYNEQLIGKIAQCGYPHDYILTALESAHLNHVTAFYELCSLQIEY
jgi:hypothetical protein